MDAAASAMPSWLSYMGRATGPNIAQQPAIVLPSGAEAVHLSGHGLAEAVALFALNEAEAALRDQHLVTFWQQLAQCNLLDDAALEELLLEALQGLAAAVQAQLQQLAALTSQLLAATPAHPNQGQAAAAHAARSARLLGLSRRYSTSVSALLLSSAPLRLEALLRRYYGAKLQQLVDVLAHSADEDGCEAGSSDGADGEADGGFCQENPEPWVYPGDARRPSLGDLAGTWLHNLRCVAARLDELELGAASEEAYTAVVNGHMRAHLAAMACGVFDRRVLPAACRYLGDVPLTFLHLLLTPEGGGSCGGLAAVRLQEWRLRLSHLVFEQLGGLRAADMFDMVVDFPDSAPAVADLAACLSHANLANVFVARFVASLRLRLLHAGAATSDIIHTYVSTIQALQEVDPSGALLEAVGAPIRGYLRGRPDTIRRIVSMLTEDDGSGSLLQQLGDGGGGGGRLGEQGAALVAEAEGDDSALALLQAAEPGAATPAGPGASGGGSGSGTTVVAARPGGDLLSLLIGIYGSRRLFMDEYRTMLGGRLLSKVDYDVERELTTLELLKIRFGDANLSYCEVMLRDMADSKRLNTSIQQLQPTHQTPVKGGSAPPPPPPALGLLSTTICSYLFWPELAEHKLVLPADVAAALEVYGERYHHLKAPRKLVWRHTLGVVELDVSVGGAPALTFRVTPLHAALLLRFSDAAPVHSAAALAAALQVPAALVRRKALFWVSSGVLLEGRLPGGGDVVYRRAEALDPSRPVVLEATDTQWSDDVAAASTAADDRLLAEMRPFENYIVGMLSSHPAGVALERLHALLRRFVVGEPRYEGRSPEQLAAFLALMASGGKVQLENGVYKKAAAPAAAGGRS